MMLEYGAELVSITRGSPNLFNSTVPVEPVSDEVVVCDADTDVSLFIDGVQDEPTCASPMLQNIPPPPAGSKGCYLAPPQNECASGWTFQGNRFYPYCTPPIDWSGEGCPSPMTYEVPSRPCAECCYPSTAGVCAAGVQFLQRSDTPYYPYCKPF